MNCYFTCQKLSKFSKTCITTTKESALAPFILAHPVAVSRSNGQRSRLEAGGGIPCRPNPAATLLVWCGIWLPVPIKHHQHPTAGCCHLANLTAWSQSHIGRLFQRFHGDNLNRFPVILLADYRKLTKIAYKETKNLIHLSTYFCHHRHSHHPSLLHCSTPGSKPTFSTNLSHLNSTSLPIGLLSWTWDWTRLIMLINLFLVFLLHFLLVPCGRLSWLPVSFLLHVKYTLSYRIVAKRSYVAINTDDQQQ